MENLAAELFERGCCDSNAQRHQLTAGSEWPENVKAGFVDFVRGEGGAFIFHSRNNAFPNWPQYNDIIGLCWRPAAYGTALQTNEAGDHPCFAWSGTLNRTRSTSGSSGAPAFRSSESSRNAQNLANSDPEVYHSTRGPAKDVEVLSCAQDPRYKEYWPLDWTVKLEEVAFTHRLSDASGRMNQRQTSPSICSPPMNNF